MLLCNVRLVLLHRSICFIHELSNLSLFGVTVVLAVGDDEVVDEVEAHGIARSLQFVRDAVVVARGACVAAWVVVNER